MTSASRRLLGAAGAAGLAGAALIVLVTPAAQAVPTDENFDFTGAPEDFVVPEGVCEVTIDAFGAGGGDSDQGAPGGLGGRATATIEVTPGETLVVRVGGQGETGPPTEDSAPEDGDEGPQPEGGPADFAAGGFNGGGDGGTGSSPAGAGGGASDVRQGGDALSNRVVVAGGGGGAGGEAEDGQQSQGGDGGGESGTDGSNSESGTEGGDGGTQAAGGSGGDPDGGAGTAGQGGDGGSESDNDTGGGGGGGLFGGGGGASDVDKEDDGGGGGGGSGFGPTGVAFETGIRAGNGIVTITYDPDAGGCEPQAAEVVQVTPAFTG